jgi:hypothetical protein
VASPLPPQPHRRARDRLRGQLQIERLAVGEGDTLRFQGGGLVEIDLQAIGHVGTALRLCALPEAAEAALIAPAAENAVEDIAEVGRRRIAEIGTATAAAEAACLRPAAAIAERRLGIALLVDLATIILGALILVRQQIVSGRHLGEPGGRLRIVLVAIGMKLLGELAISLLDRSLIRAARNTQSRVQICHRSSSYTKCVAHAHSTRGKWHLSSRAALSRANGTYFQDKS